MLESADGMADLRALGARSVPVVSQGARFVFAQVIADVVEFLGLDDDPAPVLSPRQLSERYEQVLSCAVPLVAQMPDAHLARTLPNRPRSWRVLLHHVFQIPTAFLDMEETGAPMTYEALVSPPPQDMVRSADIARFGEGVQRRFNAWWSHAKDSDFGTRITVYFGETTRHEMLERTVWHSTQHVRQVASLLEQSGLEPCARLRPEHLQGLPLTERVWDEP